MCLIIAPGADGKVALLPRDVFDYVYSRNNDGFGAMWVEDGRVQHFKQLDKTGDEIYATMERMVDEHPDVIFHMRYKTHGRIIPGLAHPFRILHKNRHGKDLFFMHNGILSAFGTGLNPGQSDTTNFKDKILVPLLTRNPDALEDESTWASINKLTSGSRLVFMDDTGKVKVTSSTTWNNRYGLLLSNTYMLPTETKSYSYGSYSYYTDDDAADDYYVAGTGGKSTGSNVTTLPPQQRDATERTTHYVYYRNIDINGTVKGYWCSSPIKGYVRTEVGTLYKDHGANKIIHHYLDLIPVSTATVLLANAEVPVVNLDDPLDDDVPFDDEEEEVAEEKTTDTSKGTPAPIDARLRYARLVHNLYAGSVTSREHLIGDLIGMGEDEMSDFVKEDPQNAHTVVAELIEMVLEFNDALWSKEPNHPFVLNTEKVVENGNLANHQESMKEITQLRRAEYEKKLTEQRHKETEERLAAAFNAAYPMAGSQQEVA